MKMETVAILSTGEMGHSVASVLGSHGLRVVTCLAGRSARTVGLAKKAGALNLSTLEEVAAQSDLVISIVVPSAARPLAEALSLAIAETRKPVLFADANAISPMTAKAIEGIITEAGGRFADVCIIGTAAKVGRGTTFYASGAWAADFAELGKFGLQIEILGDRPGQASAFKIVYAGLTKGVSSLLVESLLLAHSLGILEPIMNYICPEVKRFGAEYRRKDGRSVGKVVLIGGGAMLKGITNVAIKNFGIETVTGDSFSKAEYPAFLHGVLKEAGPTFSIAMGIALRGLQSS